MVNIEVQHIKGVVKKMPFVIRYVPDKYKTIQYDNTIQFDNTIEFVLRWFKTQELCFRTINTCSFIFHSVPDPNKTHKIRDKAICNYL